MDHFFRAPCRGAGEDSPATIHRRRNIRNLAFSPSGHCLQAVIDNGLNGLAGEALAFAMMNINPIQDVSVTKAGAWLEHWSGSYHQEKVSIPNGVDQEEWLGFTHNGILWSM